MAKFFLEIETPQTHEPTSPQERMAERNRISAALSVVAYTVGLGRFSGSVGNGSDAIGSGKFRYQINGKGHSK
jgi:hypothetical protein